MSSLAELPEIVGFFSYSRDDDQDSDGALTTLRRRIQNELRGQLGRTSETLRLWQDAEAIPPGTLWNSQIEAAIAQAVFFIPIVTPRVINSRYCDVEFGRFLNREKELGRADLVFPIIYIEVDDLKTESRWRDHPILRTIAERQYVDWSEYRYDLDSVQVRRLVGAFCRTIVGALRRAVPERGAQIEPPSAAAQPMRPAIAPEAPGPAAPRVAPQREELAAQTSCSAPAVEDTSAVLDKREREATSRSPPAAALAPPANRRVAIVLGALAMLQAALQATGTIVSGIVIGWELVAILAAALTMFAGLLVLRRANFARTGAALLVAGSFTWGMFCVVVVFFIEPDRIASSLRDFWPALVPAFLAVPICGAFLGWLVSPLLRRRAAGLPETSVTAR